MSSLNQGKNADQKDLSEAGFTPDGVTKGSRAAEMQSEADKTGEGKELVSDLQSAGAKEQGFSGNDTSRKDMDSAGFESGGVVKDSLGANTQSSSDKSGTGVGLTSTLQSIGAKK